MKKIIILIPVFNDWESLKKLLNEIEENVRNIKNILIECLVINDASTIQQPKLIKPKSFQSLKILNMKKNKGHARCNAFGIRFISKNKDFDNLILMDGDGEDRPVELIKLINKSFQDPEKYLMDNTLGTTNLSLQVKENKIPKFIIASTSSIYGDTGEQLAVENEDELLYPPSIYASTKSFGEILAKNILEDTNTHIQIPRFFTVYGPYGRPDMAYYSFLENLRKNKRMSFCMEINTGLL